MDFDFIISNFTNHELLEIQFIPIQLLHQDAISFYYIYKHYIKIKEIRYLLCLKLYKL